MHYGRHWWPLWGFLIDKGLPFGGPSVRLLGLVDPGGRLMAARSTGCRPPIRSIVIVSVLALLSPNETTVCKFTLPKAALFELTMGFFFACLLCISMASN